MVTSSTQGSFKVDYWAFLKPFTANMWFATLGLIVFHALALWGYDGGFRQDHNRNVNKEQCSAFTSLYYAFATFTTSDVVQPKAKETGFLSMGFLFFVLIFTNSYVANLASYLSSPTVATLRVSSPTSANSAGTRVCVLYGSSAHEYLLQSNRFPGIVWVTNEQIDTVDDMFTYMHAGNCDATIVTQLDWQLHSVNKKSNPECNLFLAGDPIATFGGAYAYKADYDSTCTAFMESVLSFHIVAMKADNTLQTLIDMEVAAANNANCGAYSVVSTGASKLTLRDMAGSFFLYLIFMGLGILMHLFHMYKAWRGKQRNLNMAHKRPGGVFVKPKHDKPGAPEAGDLTGREVIKVDDAPDSGRAQLPYQNEDDSDNQKKDEVDGGDDRGREQGSPRDHPDDIESADPYAQFHTFGQFAGDMSLPPPENEDEEAN